MSTELSATTLNILLDYGWYHNRVVNTDLYEKYLAELGQTISYPVLTFLQSFGGLKIDKLLIDPVEAYRNKGSVEFYEQWIGVSLCPVGILNDALLLMSSKGNLYSAWQGYSVQLWGKEYEALNNILVNKEYIIIPKPEHMILPKPPAPLAPKNIDFQVQSNNDWQPIFRDFTVKGIVFRMCKVPSGTFKMGRDDIASRSQPEHQQYITEPFWIGVSLVTKLQWQQIVASTQDMFPVLRTTSLHESLNKNTKSVLGVTWYQSQKFTACLGEGWRLPTEAEWEFALRGPDNLLDPFNGQKEGQSWVGCQEMGGHFWEWTASIFRVYPYDPTDGRENLTNNGSRALRNLGFNEGSLYADSTRRLSRIPTQTSHITSFRVCIADHYINFYT